MYRCWLCATVIFFPSRISFYNIFMNKQTHFLHQIKFDILIIVLRVLFFIVVGFSCQFECLAASILSMLFWKFTRSLHSTYRENVLWFFFVYFSLLYLHLAYFRAFAYVRRLMFAYKLSILRFFSSLLAICIIMYVIRVLSARVHS